MLWMIGMLYRTSTNKSYTLMQIFYMYGLWTGEFDKLPPTPNNYNLEHLVEDLLQISDDKEYGFFIECDLEYPVENKQTTENFPLCPYQVEADCELFSDYMKFVKQPNYKSTQKLLCDLTNKQKCMMNYRKFQFYIKRDLLIWV